MPSKRLDKQASSTINGLSMAWTTCVNCDDRDDEDCELNLCGQLRAEAEARLKAEWQRGYDKAGDAAKDIIFNLEARLAAAVKDKDYFADAAIKNADRIAALEASLAEAIKEITNHANIESDLSDKIDNMKVDIRRYQESDEHKHADELRDQADDLGDRLDKAEGLLAEGVEHVTKLVNNIEQLQAELWAERLDNAHSISLALDAHEENLTLKACLELERASSIVPVKVGHCPICGQPEDVENGTCKCHPINEGEIRSITSETPAEDRCKQCWFKTDYFCKTYCGFYMSSGDGKGGGSGVQGDPATLQAAVRGSSSHESPAPETPEGKSTEGNGDPHEGWSERVDHS